MLTDLSVGTYAVATTTASAYDLHSGEQVWGPVDVPGPHVGPGLVFGEVAPGGALGASGPRVGLDSATGEVTASEEDLDGARLVGEYHGTFLLVDNGHLVARDTHDGRERWSVALADLELAGVDQIAAAPDSEPGPGLALVGAHEPGYALVDVADGTILAVAVQDAQTDLSTGVHVTVAHDRITGHHPDGGMIWDHPAERAMQIASAGEGVLYLLAGDRVTTHYTATGEPADVYQSANVGQPALPRYSDASGAAVLQTSQGLLLATTSSTELAGVSPSSPS